MRTRTTALITLLTLVVLLPCTAPVNAAPPMGGGSASGRGFIYPSGYVASTGVVGGYLDFRLRLHSNGEPPRGTFEFTLMLVNYDEPLLELKALQFDSLSFDELTGNATIHGSATLRDYTGATVTEETVDFIAVAIDALQDDFRITIRPGSSNQIVLANDEFERTDFTITVRVR